MTEFIRLKIAKCSLGSEYSALLMESCSHKHWHQLANVRLTKTRPKLLSNKVSLICALWTVYSSIYLLNLVDLVRSNSSISLVVSNEQQRNFVGARKVLRSFENLIALDLWVARPWKDLQSLRAEAVQVATWSSDHRRPRIDSQVAYATKRVKSWLTSR